MNDVDLSKPSGMAKTSLILGICALIPFAGWAIGLAAIIIGIVDLVKIKNNEAGASGRKFDITGIILGVVLPWIFSMIIIAAIWGSLLFGALGSLSSY